MIYTSAGITFSIGRRLEIPTSEAVLYGARICSNEAPELAGFAMQMRPQSRP